MWRDPARGVVLGRALASVVLTVVLAVVTAGASASAGPAGAVTPVTEAAPTAPAVPAGAQPPIRAWLPSTQPDQWALWEWRGSTWVLMDRHRALSETVHDRTSQPWSDSSGTTSHYHLLGVPGGGQPVSGLLVYLDGDGMYGFDHPRSDVLGGGEGIVATASAHDYATLAIRTPDSESDTFWEEGRVNARYIEDLTRRVAGQLGVTSVWFMGFSGGSQLLTQYLLPEAPELCRAGGVLLVGGGGRPSRRSTPSSDRSCPITWVTGTADRGRDDEGYDAFRDARRGARLYAAQGWPARMWTPYGVDHDEIRTRLANVLAGALGRASMSGAAAQMTPSATIASATSM